MSATMSKWALISVTDKTGVVELARGLAQAGYGLLSTGGTAKTLRDAGLTVKDVAEHTGSPEILDGRVKTLHPKTHGGILFDRADEKHRSEAATHGIQPIDAVVVNLYRFADEAVARGLSATDAIHHIDIGGPAMLRAAAKNWAHVAAVCDPSDYPEILAALKAGGIGSDLRQRLAAKTFATVSAYDAMIAAYLAGAAAESVTLTKIQDLRYGENPHQAAGLYRVGGAEPQGFGALKILQGKEVSYNNILDLDAASALAAEFEDPAVVIVKHTNPCGVAVKAGASLDALFASALACDPKSAFGGIVAMNRRVDRKAAEALNTLFLECVAAPDYDADALALLATKPNVRVVRAPFATAEGLKKVPRERSVRSVRGAWLMQDEDRGLRPRAEWQVVTKVAPSPAVLADLAFAMAVAKHVKSNAIVFAKGGMVIGVGAGQMSRLDSSHIAAYKSGERSRGGVVASDAFFPFRDGIDEAAKAGITAAIQPGGSKADPDVIAACDEHGMAMIFTGRRHFKH